MFQTRETYRPKKQRPQSLYSETQPNQAPELRYIFGALQRGEVLNLNMGLQYDNDPDIDRPVVHLDRRHVTPRDIDSYLESIKVPSPADPVILHPGDQEPPQ